MSTLRPDLRIGASEDSSRCTVYDPLTGKEYAFGDIECFLIRQIQRPRRIEEVCVACNKEFGRSYSPEDIQQFLDLLGGWGLLQDPGGERGRDGPAAAGSEAGTPLLGYLPDDDVDAIAYAPNRWHLFRPNRFLDAANGWLGPLRRLVWLIPVLFGFAILTIIMNQTIFFSDLSRAIAKYGVIGRLLFATCTTNLVAQMVRGMVARYHGASVPSFGIRLMLGIVPRFNVQLAPGTMKERSLRMRLSIAPSLARLLLFSLGVFIWWSSRDREVLSLAGVELALVSFVGMLFLLNPLWRGDGLNILATMLEMPDLRKRADRAFRRLFVRQPAVIVRHTRHRFALATFGFLCKAFLVVLFGRISYSAFRVLEGRFRGTGVSVFLMLALYVGFQMRRMARAKKAQRMPRKPADDEGDDEASTKGEIVMNTRKEPSGRKGRGRPWVRYVLVVLLLVCLFLPYSYEIGGDAEVFPAARAIIPTEMDGVLEEIFFSGGEWIEAGTPLARLSYRRQEKDLMTAKAAMQAKTFELERLRTTPSYEQILLAEAEVATAEVQARYSQTEFERLIPLYDSGRISVQEYEAARRNADVHRQQLVLAQARKETVKAQINPNQIEALLADIKRLEHEIAYYAEQLERTKLTSPISGRVVTRNLDLMLNLYMQTGQTFAEMEDTRTVWIHIAIPEFDVRYLKTGAETRFRLWAYPDREFVGVVDSIHPATEEDGNRRVVMAKVRMENPEGLLMSGMTGQAKIRGKTMPVLRAFGHAWVRFLRVEVWSWLP